jgi:16S rRNA U516 pseudouridylate synthase RsuA-like enzyme
MLRACSSMRGTLPHCIQSSGTAKIIREHALESLRKTLGEVCEIVVSEARARQVRRMRRAGEFVRDCVGTSEL